MLSLPYSRDDSHVGQIKMKSFLHKKNSRNQFRHIGILNFREMEKRETLER